MASRYLREAGARLGLVVLGLTFGLIALEALLQLGAACVRATGVTPPSFVGGRVRVACLGDSNTYGLFVPRTQAWPQQLEAFWTQDPNRPAIQVVNLGYPGMNSSRMRNQLPSILGALHPNLVMVMIGANDFWTEPDLPRDTPATLGMLAWRYSRVYRLAYMLAHVGHAEVAVSGTADAWRSPDDPSPEQLEQGVGVARGEGLELPLGWKRSKDSTGWMERLAADLTAMATLARAAGTTLVILTYPANWGVYGVANAQLRAAAQATGTPLVDLGREFDAACPDPCPDFFFRDLHPTALGYTRVARELVEQLRRQPDLLAR
jgi:lysophospholipase L1-like esterase